MNSWINTKYMTQARKRQLIDQVPAQPSIVIKRLQCMLFAAASGLLLGGGLDLLINVLRSISQPQGGHVIEWFLCWIFMALGALCGYLFIDRSGELFVQCLGQNHGIQPADQSPNVFSELVTLIAKILIAAAVIWALLMIFA